MPYSTNPSGWQESEAVSTNMVAEERRRRDRCYESKDALSDTRPVQLQKSRLEYYETPRSQPLYSQQRIPPAITPVIDYGSATYEPDAAERHKDSVPHYEERHYSQPGAYDDQQIDPLEDGIRKLTYEETTRYESQGHPAQAYATTSLDAGYIAGKSYEATSAYTHQPNISNATNRHVAGTPGKTEMLDSSYQVRNKDSEEFFKGGRVFCTLWADPQMK